MMNRFFTLLLAASCLTAVGQGANICEYPELLVPRVVFLDADSDGVWIYAQSDDPLIWDSGPTGDSLFVQECGTYDVRELVEIEGLGQLPCGFSEEVLVLTEDCLGSELEFFCGDGTVYDVESGKCIVANPSDSNFDGCVQLNDLLDLLSAYGDCGSEESAWQCGDPLEYQGYDYETVQIGEQCWFAENLRAESYENGDAIPTDLSDEDWLSTNTGAVAVNSLNLFGRLYNWYAVEDNRGLCPNIWHVPSDNEWIAMEVSIGMSYIEANSTSWRGTNQGEQLKATYGWDNNGSGTNNTGFGGLPGGYRGSSGGLSNTGGVGYWWTSTPFESFAWYRILNSSDSGVYRLDDWNQRGGLSIRCIKD